MRRMKNDLLRILVLLTFSVATFQIFSVSPEEYFWRKYLYGDTCIMEFLLLTLAAVLSSLIIFVKFSPTSKIQILSIIAFVVINVGVVLLSFNISDGGLSKKCICFQIMHFLSFVLMIPIKNSNPILILSAFMIFSSAIAYRIDGISCYTFRDDEDGNYLCNFAMLISIFVLFLVASVIILFKRFSED